MEHYYVTGYIGEGAKRMLRDLERRDDVTLVDRIISARLLRFLFFRLYYMTGQFKKFYWIKKIFIPCFDVFHLKKAEKGCMIFFNSLFSNNIYDYRMLRKLKLKYPQMRFVLYIVDPMQGFGSEENQKEIAFMDLVYSVHRTDCQKYGFLFYPLIYSAPSEAEDSAEKCDVTTDLYYLGSGIDRLPLLSRIAQRCVQIGVRAEIHVVSEQLPEETDPLIHIHTEPIPYEENEKMICSSKCILEIMHEGFNGLTQRYMEAVVYGKRLLTNNSQVKELEFYNTDYMKSFCSVEEITPDFFGDRSVDYNYEGEFSPKYFIEDIEKRFEVY